MADQVLSLVQKRFMDETVRQYHEELVRFLHRTRLFIEDYDNQSEAIADISGIANGDTLNDGRADAPVWTFQRLTQFRTFAGNLDGQVSDAERGILVSLLVRDLAQVVRNSGA